MNALTRRAVLKGATTAVAVVPFTPIPALADAAPLGPVLPDWRPAGYRGLCMSLLEDERENPLTIMFDDTFRRATDRELRHFLNEKPFFCRHVSPWKVREFFKETDGDLIAMLTERNDFRRRIQATDGDTEEAKRQLAEVTDRICCTQAKTKVGAVMQLDLVTDELWLRQNMRVVEFSLEQLRDLVWSAMRVLSADLGGDRRMPHLTGEAQS